MKPGKQHPIVKSIKKSAETLNLSKVLVALSGGADSVATAFALKLAGVNVTALHCNFHLRGEESNRDMKFVENFCHVNDIPLFTKDFDVAYYINLHKGTSIEMACRELRYNWFFEYMREGGFQRLATGHNADDNIETFFLNLLRGSGSRGLKGMESDKGGIWRPLLKFHREEILEFLKEYGIDFVVDSTNLENDYRRNFLRNKIIPLLKSEWKGFESSFDKSIENLYFENLIVEEAVLKALPSAGSSLTVETIMNFPAPLLLIKRHIEPLGPFSTTPEEILSAIKAEKPHNRTWRLKKGTILLNNKKLILNRSTP